MSERFSESPLLVAQIAAQLAAAYINVRGERKVSEEVQKAIEIIDEAQRQVEALQKARRT